MGSERPKENDLQLAQNFRGVRYPASKVKEALELTRELSKAAGSSPKPNYVSMTVTRGEETWTLDNEDEWFAEHRREHTDSKITMHWGPYELRVMEMGRSTYVTATAPQRSDVESIVGVFISAADQYQLPVPSASPKPKPAPKPPVIVFIGHGHNGDWRKVKDQLQDSHGYKVEAYEVGERAGHSIRDVLDSMLDRSSFALLMMTAEDEVGDGQIRARQNVVHEAGLFQGRLGFNRAIAVVEEGVEVFSNLNGVDQIRYPHGHVEVAVSRILATLRREFGDRR